MVPLFPYIHNYLMVPLCQEVFNLLFSAPEKGPDLEAAKAVLGLAENSPK